MAWLVNGIHSVKMWQHEHKIKPVWLFGLLDVDIEQTLVIALNGKVVLGHARCLMVPVSLVTPLLPCILLPSPQVTEPRIITSPEGNPTQVGKWPVKWFSAGELDSLYWLVIANHINYDGAGRRVVTHSDMQS